MSQPSESTYDRRSLLRRGVVIGGVAVWSIPTVTVLAGKASATPVGSKPPVVKPPRVKGESFTRTPVYEGSRGHHHHHHHGSTDTGDVLGKAVTRGKGVLPFTGINIPVIETVEIATGAVVVGTAATVAARRRPVAHGGHDQTEN